MQMEHVEGQVRERAYALWEAEGHPHGRDRHHWEQAARELMAPAAAAGKTRKPRTASPRKPARRGA